LFQPIAFKGQPSPTWETWDESIKHLNPLRGNKTDRGISNLKHEPQYDKIIDLCDNATIPGPPQPPARLPQQPVYSPVLSNRKPPPNGSWLVFDAQLSLGHATPSAKVSLQLGPKDTREKRFNPAEPTSGGASLDELTDKPLKEFLEEKGTKEIFMYEGYAERIGYPVPRPGEMRFGGVWMQPVADQKRTLGMASMPAFFSQKFMGMHFGVPKYGASWRVYYRVSRDKSLRQAAFFTQFQGNPKQFEAGGPES
jgi:hypothetical protein